MSYATKDQLKSIMADAASKTKTAVGGKVSETLLKDTVGWTGKNLIPFPYYTNKNGTLNGIEWVINSDGSITVNGTASATTYIVILHERQNKKIIETGKSYILSDGSASRDNGCYLVINCWDSSYAFTGAVVDTKKTDNVIFSVDTEFSYNAVSIGITSGTTVNNRTFKPMIRRADITDDTYEPYHESVDERLTELESTIEITDTDPGEGSDLATGKLLFVTEG